MTPTQPTLATAVLAPDFDSFVGVSGDTTDRSWSLTSIRELHDSWTGQAPLIGGVPSG